MSPRGIRNHNPGNIRHSKTIWMGQADDQPDQEFVTFESPIYGIRALYKILKTYQSKHGLKTVAQIINRWAPPNENDTAAYVKAVAAACSVVPKQEIDLPKIAEKLVAAIIKHENGQQPYSAADIQRAIEMA
jgi:hypothetical protein